MKKALYNTIMFGSVFMMLSSCSDYSPEKAGKEYAAKKCECEELEKRREIELTTNLLDDAKNGKIKTLEEAYRLADDYRMKHPLTPEDNEKYKKCWEELKQFEQEIKLKFAKQDDRVTIKNAFEANMEVCSKELRARSHWNSDEFHAALNIPTENKAMMEKMVQDSIAAAEQAAQATAAAMRDSIAARSR